MDPQETSRAALERDLEALREEVTRLRTALAEAERAVCCRREVFECHGDVVVLLDPFHCIRDLCPSAERVLVAPPGADLAGNLDPYLHERDRDAFHASLLELEAPPHRAEVMARLQTPGGFRWYEWRHAARVDGEGRIEAITCVGRDVTERKLSMDSVSDSEERYRELMDNVPVGVYQNTPGPDGRFVLANPAIAEMFGFACVDEFLEMPVSACYRDPAERERISNRLLAEGELEGIELELQRRDGTPFWGSVNAHVVRDARGEIVYFDGVIQDITARRETEEAIRRRDAILEAVSFAAAHFLRSDDWEEVINEALERLGRAAACHRAYVFEVRAEEEEVYCTIRHEWTDDASLSSEDNPGLQDFAMRAGGFGRWVDLLDRGETVAGNARDFPLPERDILAEYNIGAMLLAPIMVDKRWWGFIGFDEFGTTRDWSAQEQEALSTAAHAIGASIGRRRADANRLLMATLVEQSSEAVVVVSSARNVVFVNPGFTALTGYSPEEVLGKPSNFMQPAVADPARAAAMMPTALRGEVWRGRTDVRHKDGRMLVCEAAVTAITHHLQDEALFLVVQHDVGQQLQLEERLRQAHKLEALGTLAGGLAREFRSIINAATGWLELAAEELDSGTTAARHLARALRAHGRANDLVTQILTFSRSGDKVYAPVVIAPAVHEAMQLLRGGLPKGVNLETVIEPTNALVAVDPAHVKQIVTNLGMNAFRAMESKGGDLRVVLAEEGLSAEEVLQRPNLHPGPYVRLTVSDTGAGMDAAALAHVFEPFFTTSAPGEGSGLGLATVHGLVRGLGGDVFVESTLGEGTAFDVYFPVCGVAAPLDPEEAKDQAPLRGSERVIVVDDDAALVEMLQLGLGALGYDVYTFTQAKDALDAIREMPEDFDVLVTDQVMPVMTGLDLAAEVRDILPRLPFIIVSGYSDNLSSDRLQALGLGKPVTKPAGPRSIAAAIRAALDGADD